MYHQNKKGTLLFDSKKCPDNFSCLHTHFSIILKNLQKHFNHNPTLQKSTLKMIYNKLIIFTLLTLTAANTKNAEQKRTPNKVIQIFNEDIVDELQDLLEDVESFLIEGNKFYKYYKI